MPRTDDAKNWQPSDFDQKLIDRMTDYLVAAERCLLGIRKLDASCVQTLWLELQAVFHGDRVKYPSAMAAQDDKKGRSFFAKCQAICFPPPSRAPPSPKIASLECQSSQEFCSHLFAGEIEYRANLGALKALGEKDVYKAAVEAENDFRDRPLNLLDEKIRRRDGTTVYTVVDCGTSALNGNCVILEDGQGGRKQISTDEFYEIRDTVQF